MKKIALLTTLTLIGVAAQSHADDLRVLENYQDASSLRRALQIKKALEILSKEGVLLLDENQSIKINNSILNDLRSSGVLTEGVVKEGTVCIGAGI